jgi:hypothetical protein
MCHECDALDKHIAHYRDMQRRVTDQRTLDGIALLILKCEAGKVELHPERRPTPPG